MEHFVIGTDEACLMAIPGGAVKVIGEKRETKARENSLRFARINYDCAHCINRGIYGTHTFLVGGQEG